MEQFEQAVSYMTENFGRFLGVVNDAGDDLIKQENGIKNAILVTEKNVIRFAGILSAISKNKQVSNNADELRFIGVFYDDFIRHYYTIRGMALEAREGKKVNEKIFKTRVATFMALVETFKGILRTVFNQDIDNLQ